MSVSVSDVCHQISSPSSRSFLLQILKSIPADFSFSSPANVGKQLFKVVMKTITASVISSKPVSRSKAASVLKHFVSKETGASEALSAILSRSSASFNELAQFHKNMESRKSRSLGDSEEPHDKKKKKRRHGNN